MDVKRYGPITAEQKQMLINFVEKYPQVNSGKFSQQFTVKQSQNLWQEITNELNAIPGAKKPWQKWRKTWQDLKNSTKAKCAAVKRYKNATGGGPPLSPKSELKPEEEHIANIISKTAIEGHEGVLESNTEFEFVISEDLPVYDTIYSTEEILTPPQAVSPTTLPKAVPSSEADYVSTPHTEKRAILRTNILEGKNRSRNDKQAAVEEGNGNSIQPKVQVQKKNQRPIRIQRLQNSVTAMEKLRQQTDHNLKIIEKYYAKKLRLMKYSIEVHRRIASALEAIARKM